MDQWLSIIIGSVFILLGILMSFYLLLKLAQAYKSKYWPSVVGDLQSAELRRAVYRGIDADGTADQASANVVDFEYVYSVHGRSYTGKRVTFSDAVNKTSGSLRKIQELYQGKDQIVVYYNPANPQNSVLIPGPDLYNFTPLITSLLFILAGLFLMTLEL